MFPLRCTVRDCLHLLQPGDRCLRCERGHHFDQAKEGYWNLTQPQDRKSRHAGDSDHAVLARHGWIKRGHMASLVDTIRPWVDDTKTTATVARTLDLGCGEGSFGQALFDDEADGYCGIDLSKRAIRLAARQWPAATWVLANADRVLPVPDASIDRVLSLFGRRPVSEISRVLAPMGTLFVAVPGADDLSELREQIHAKAIKRDRSAAIIDEFTKLDFELVDHGQWTHQAILSPAAIEEALSMTYRAGRNAEKERAGQLDSSKSVTLAADLLRFRKTSSG